MKRILMGLAVLAAFAAAGGRADANDSWITTKAKLTLLTTDGIHVSAPNVDTVDGKVTLHGKVDSVCLLYTSPSPRDGLLSRMPSSA